MKTPNFDDKDLAIAGLVLLGIIGLLVGWAMEADTVAMYSFVTGLGVGIAGLATGRKKPDIKE